MDQIMMRGLVSHDKIITLVLRSRDSAIGMRLYQLKIKQGWYEHNIFVLMKIMAFLIIVEHTANKSYISSLLLLTIIICFLFQCILSINLYSYDWSAFYFWCKVKYICASKFIHQATPSFINDSIDTIVNTNINNKMEDKISWISDDGGSNSE